MRGLTYRDRRASLVDHVVGAGEHQRRHIEPERPVSYTILQPNVFHQNMLRMAAPIRERGRFRSAVGDARISMIDVRDIAEVAVKALTEDGHAGNVYVLTGPEAVTYLDVARLLSNAIGNAVVYEATNQLAAAPCPLARRPRSGVG